MEILGVTVPVWVMLMVVAFILYTYMMSRHMWTFRRMGVPGPTPLPIIGNMMEMGAGIRAFDKKALQKYGKVFGYFDINFTNLVVADKDMVREILVKQFNNFSDRKRIPGLNGDLEHGLINITGDHWKHNRSIISPTFSSGKLRQMVPLIQEACDTLVRTSRNAMLNGDNGQVEMRRLFGGFSMDVISSTAFGIHVDSQGNPDDPYVMYAKKMFEFSIAKQPWMLVMMFYPALTPLLAKLGLSMFPRDSMAYFRKLVTQLLGERRRQNEVGRKDFLQLMVDAQEGRLELDAGDEDSKEQIKLSNLNHQGLTFDEILGNAELFFVAGYETTSVTLTMIAYNLATNPECQDKLRQDIKDKIGTEILDCENIKKLQYLDMCINESLRLYPPGLRLNRTCVKTTTIKNITIPAGISVDIPIHAMHHDPEVWEKPEVFNPERFSASERDNHDPLDFMPFGYGPRNCIAMRLALLEAKMATANMVRNFRLSVGSKTDIPPKIEDHILLKPSYVWLKLEDIKSTN